ncbi:hypothetical protein LTR81_010376 [Elasticomyces elasticus]
MKEGPSLMSLPPEIRELTWAQTMVQKQPLTAYVGVRTHRNTPEARIQRQMRAYPGLPSLGLVSTQVRREAMGIYWSENVFEFCLNRQKTYELFRWHFAKMSFLRGDGGDENGDEDIKDQDEAETIGRLNKINLHFQMCTVIGEFDDGSVYMRVDMTDRSMTLEYHGALAMECTCVLSKLAPLAMQRMCMSEAGWQADAFLWVANIIERELQNGWSRPDRDLGWNKAPRHCSACQKPSVMSRPVEVKG